MTDCTIIGIDPGTNVLGFGVISIKNRKPYFVDMGVLHLKKEKDAYAKLCKIFNDIGRLCDVYKPTYMALESPFMDKNAQVILKLGRAQGAAILSATTRGVDVIEYAPRKAKIAITGNGAASKEQVSNILSKTLNIDVSDTFLDATDALAIAMCHFYQMLSPFYGTKTTNSWEKFIKENPDRVK